MHAPQPCVASTPALMPQMASDHLSSSILGHPSCQSPHIDWSFMSASQNQFKNPDLNMICSQVTANDVCHKVVRSRKREREEAGSCLIHGVQSSECSSSWCSCFGENIAVRMQQEMKEVDMFVFMQMERLRAELEQNRRKHWNNVFRLMDNGVQRVLRGKDEEITNLSRRNSSLEEKLKILTMERQTWKNLACSNEVAAVSLRRDLEVVRARVGHCSGEIDCGGEVEDASSCCNESASGVGTRKSCRRCHLNQTSVLVLPCRHLCLCTQCDPMTRECPICMLAKTTSIQVCMS